jgi:hypothetical protein
VYPGLCIGCLLICWTGDLITFSPTNEVTKPFVHHNGTIIKASNRQQIKHKLQDNSQKYANINLVMELENVQYDMQRDDRAWFSHRSCQGLEHAAGTSSPPQSCWCQI